MELATETLTVLLVEDSRVDAQVAVRLLRQTSPSSTVIHASRLAEALEYLEESSVDVVLLDLALPDSRGLGTLDRVHEAAPHVPIVVFTGQQDENLGVEAVRRGAQDYIEKGRLEDWLLARVLRYAIERKQAARALQGAQDALAARERRYWALIQNSYDGILLYDAQGVISYISPSVRRISGYDADELIGRRMQECIVQEDLPAVIAELEALREQPGGHIVVEHRLRRKDGSVIWVEAAVTNLLHHPDVGAFVSNFTDVTERKHAEQIRRRLAAIVASSDDAIIGQALDGRITDWNAGARHLYGYAEDEVLGRSVALLFPPDRSSEAAAMLDKLARGEYIRQYEAVQTCKDGTCVEVALTMSPIKDDGGRVVGISTIARDITKRRQAERAVQESEERLRFALEAGQMGTWELNLQTKRVIWSEETERIYGLEPGQFDGRIETLQALIHPDDHARVWQAYWESMETGTYEEEYRIVRPDGEIRWLAARGQAEYDEQGHCRRMGGTIADITERKRAEEARRRSEALNRAVLRSLNAMIAVLDEEGNIVAVNDRWTRQAQDAGAPGVQRTGVGVNYLAVCRTSAAAGDDLAGEALGGIEAVIQGEAPSFTQEYPCSDAERERWFRMEVTPLEGKVGGVVVAHHDVTERKKAEAQLVEAKEQAEEMSRLKSAFLANMSHEIRTPLTAVIGFAELLKDEVQGDAVELAEMVHRGGERLLTTLNSVLDLAQLESATLELHWHWHDVGAMVEEAVETFRSRAVEKGVALHASVPESSVWGLVDVGALTRILNNLVSNAVKFTPSGHITVGTMLDGGELVLWVSDTGVGIGEAFMHRIFEAFSQESSGTTRDYEGTGIGMTITSQLVDLMGGTLEVHTAKGHGSTFVVRLPHRMPPETNHRTASDIELHYTE